jgi:hypothetical protein
MLSAQPPGGKYQNKRFLPKPFFFLQKKVAEKK